MERVKLFKEFVNEDLSEINFLNEIEPINEIAMSSAGVRSFLRAIYTNVDVLKKMGFKTFKDLVGYIKSSGLQDWNELRDEAKEYGLVIAEATINEAKTLTRDEMMNIMRTKYGLSFVKTSEEFDGEKGGIWLGSSSDLLMPNAKDSMFDYYHGGSKFPQGIHKDLAKFLEKCGWYGQFADPGTVMLWPK